MFRCNGKEEKSNTQYENTINFAYLLSIKICICFIVSQTCNLRAQCNYSDPLNQKIPEYLQGDTSLFQITAGGIQSNSPTLSAHSFQLWIPCTNLNKDTQVWEFNLELGINTSSLNKLHFGYLHPDSSESYFEIGNTKDQLYFKQNEYDTFLGLENAFDKTSISYKIQLVKCKSSLFIEMFPAAPDTPYRFHLKLNNPTHQGLFWRIFQSGKTAMGKHRFSQLYVGPPKIQTGNFPKKPHYGDLRFSEILMDASPNYGSLPDVEYIEIEKLTHNWITLHNSQIQINSKNYLFPSYNWDTGITHLILSPNCKAYASIPCLELPFNLLNSENTIVLRDIYGNLLDSIQVYSRQQHLLFQDGGVSLEAPLEPAPLGNSSTWYSNANQGGTPGTYGKMMVHARPKTTSHQMNLIYQNPNLYFQFIEPIMSNQWIYISTQTQKDSVYYASGLKLILPFNLNSDSLNVEFIDRFQKKQSVRLPVYLTGKGDIEITEIYFEGSQNSDFVEIINTGKHALSFSDLDLLIYDIEGHVKQIVPLTNLQNNWLLPQQYIAITNNPFPLIRNYDSIALHQIIEIATFPNLSIQGGEIEIVHHLYGRIDRAPFNRSMHTQVLRTEVSLEKKSLGLSSKYMQNWMSCLTLSYPYSPTQGRNIASNTSEAPIVLLHRRRWFLSEAESIFPIQFNFPSEGYVFYISLFDAWGNPIALILNGLPMPKSGVYPLLLEDLPRIYQSGNYVLKFEALHIEKQQRIRQIERISILYDP